MDDFDEGVIRPHDARLEADTPTSMQSPESDSDDSSSMSEQYASADSLSDSFLTDGTAFAPVKQFSFDTNALKIFKTEEYTSAYENLVDFCNSPNQMGEAKLEDQIDSGRICSIIDADDSSTEGSDDSTAHIRGRTITIEEKYQLLSFKSATTLLISFDTNSAGNSVRVRAMCSVTVKRKYYYIDLICRLPDPVPHYETIGAGAQHLAVILFVLALRHKNILGLKLSSIGRMVDTYKRWGFRQSPRRPGAAKPGACLNDMEMLTSDYEQYAELLRERVAEFRQIPTYRLERFFPLPDPRASAGAGAGASGRTQARTKAKAKAATAKAKAKASTRAKGVHKPEITPACISVSHPPSIDRTKKAALKRTVGKRNTATRGGSKHTRSKHNKSKSKHNKSKSKSKHNKSKSKSKHTRSKHNKSKSKSKHARSKYKRTNKR